MKYLVPVIVLPALAIGCAFLATKDNDVVSGDEQSYHYTILWDSMSFDETVWLAVNEISNINDSLPQQVHSYCVEVRSNDEEMPIINFIFDRSSLVKLIAGEIDSEDFIREYVKFN